MRPLLIIQTGHAPAPIRARHGDFAHWFRLGLQVPAHAVHRVDAPAGEALPPPRMCAAAVITGSPAMVTDDDPWSAVVAEWIVRAMKTGLPMFGVCYGHQLMAQALGGRVADLPDGREIGTQAIELLPGAGDDPLLRGLPATFKAHTTHRQTVLEPPSGATVLARSRQDPHQILRYGEYALSTQFHPEFSVSVMRSYLHLRKPQLREEALDVNALLAGTGAAPHARRLLRRFGTLHASR